jgi:RNA polymerase sigma-70 factor (ECF subfamily)
MKAEPAIRTTIYPDSQTAEELVRDYLEIVYTYASRRLPTTADAEDVVAETFQAAIQNLHRKRNADIKLWLLGIARRKVADTLRKRKRRREDSLQPWLATGESLQHDLERAESVASIRRIVLALPEDQREALLLQHLEGLSIAEIGIVMGRSPAAINSLLQRARKRAFQEGKDYFLEEIS